MSPDNGDLAKAAMMEALAVAHQINQDRNRVLDVMSEPVQEVIDDAFMTQNESMADRVERAEAMYQRTVDAIESMDEAISEYYGS